jgi:hypothetical protein
MEDSPSTNSAWTAGVERYNEYHKDCSIERLFNKKSQPLVKGGYVVYTGDSFNNDSSTANDNSSIRSFSLRLSAIVALSAEHPDDKWGIVEVPADANCFPHCGAAFMDITSPHQIDSHFHGEIRNGICEVMISHMNDASCLAETSMTQMEYAQLQDMGDDEDDVVHKPRVLDITGRNPPERLLGQSDADFDVAMVDYEQEWKANLAEIEADYMAKIGRFRKIGARSINILILGMALFTGKIVEVFMYSDLLNKYTLAQVCAPEGHHDGTVMPLMFDPKKEHFSVGIPLRLFADYEAPSDPPKNSLTHDPLGHRRDPPLTEADLGVSKKRSRGDSL